MESEPHSTPFPDVETCLSGIEVSPCHRCGEPGKVHITLRRDKKHSVSIGCQCGTPYSVIYNGDETVVELVRLWNRYQSLRELTKGRKA